MDLFFQALINFGPLPKGDKERALVYIHTHKGEERRKKGGWRRNNGEGEGDVKRGRNNG